VYHQILVLWIREQEDTVESTGCRQESIC